jgi:putative ABC transport system permease protein
MTFSDFLYEVKEGLAISVQAIRANKMRSVLTTLGVVIGITSVTLMGTALKGLQRGFNDSIAKIGADVLYVQKWPWFVGDDWWKYRNRPDIKIESYKAIERQATLINSATPVVGTVASVKYGSVTSDNVYTVGANEQYLETQGILLELGRFFSKPEADGGRPVCVIGYDVAQQLFPHETPLGKNIRVGSSIFRVIGVLAKQGSFLGLFSLDDRVVVPFEAFIHRFGTKRGIEIDVRASSLKTLDDTKEELRGILRKVRHVAPGAEDNFSINQQEMFIKTFNTVGIVVAGVGLFITTLSLFVGAIGIMNIMFVSVTERTKEIGIRKAIGAKRRTILLQFLTEAAILSLMGGVIGVTISYPLSLLINQILPTSMPISVVTIALVISVIVGLVSGFLPANRASKLDPVEALRYE